MTVVDIVVTGVGMVSGFGHTAASTWSKLLLGRTAIALRHPFSELPILPMAMLGKHPACLKGILMAAVEEALADAQLSPPLPHLGVVVGSSRGHQAQWEAYGQSPSSHADTLFSAVPWLSTLPHMPAIAVAQHLKSSGPVHAPTAACATGLVSIFQGAELIRRGDCAQVLVGAVETPLTRLTLAGFQKMGALASTGCYPFDYQREGLVLGEGAAVLILESQATAIQRGVSWYGRILGAGLTADAHHMTAPDPHQKSLQTALKRCLNHANLSPERIDYIHPHGTSTQLNDANEARLIQRHFPPSVWVSGSKGAIGHTLGASGAMGAIFCLLALKQSMLPPYVGLKSPAFSLNWVHHMTPYPLETALCFSFGFGGQNLILAMGR